MILKNIFDYLENFDKNTLIIEKMSEKYLYLLGIFDRIKSKENFNKVLSEKLEFYDIIWKNFLKISINSIEYLEKEESNTKKKYNIQIEKFIEFHSKYETEKGYYIKQEINLKNEVQILNNILLEKESQIKKLEEAQNDLKKKLLIKEKCETNEIYLYTQKQLTRDNKMLSNENKQLRDNIIKLEKEIVGYKQKEVKIMKILYSLSKKGISINEILEKDSIPDLKQSNLNLNSDTITNETINENRAESISINDSMYAPLYIIEPTNNVTKQNLVPKLNLININNSLYNFGSDESTIKEKNNTTTNIKLTSNQSDLDFNEIKDESFSEKNLSHNNKNANKDINNYLQCSTSNLNAMEKELFKTFKSINKEKNVSSNKSTLNNSENNFIELKSYSKKNSSNDSMKTGNNEIKDSTSNSEQDIEKISINSSWNYKNPINLSYFIN